jgi:fluoroacetyl-CoA thioesterase
VEGRRVRFHVEAWDDVDRICEGTHERHVIDPLRFAAKVEQKRTAP